MSFRRLRAVLAVVAVLAVAVLVSAPAPAGAQDNLPPGEPIDPQYLGEFTFIGDGVIEFVIVDDQIIGRVTTRPESTGIELVGGVRPCPEFADDDVFVLDRTGVGEWYWYTNLNGSCERLGGAPVTVRFGILGADALGEMPRNHPRFEQVPTGHSMLRLVPLLPTPPTTTTTTPTTTGATTTTTGAEEELVIIGVNDGPRADEPFWRDAATYISFVVVLALLGVSSWGWSHRASWCPVGRRRRAASLVGQQDGPAGPDEHDAHDEREPECHCSVTVEINGPREFGTCCEQELTLALRSCGTERGTGGVTHDPLRIHLDADVAGHDNWDFVDAIYEATLTPTCEGGGRAVVEEARTGWEIISQTADGFVLEVRVLVPIECPDGVERERVRATAQLEVAYHKAPCLVAVVYKVNPFKDVSHIDVHIQCGSYSEVFGYFPLGERTFASTFLGASGTVIRVPGSEVVKDRSSGLTVDVKDGLGREYRSSTHHSHLDLDVHWIETEDCSACGKLRNEWEILARTPGTYWLTSNNCATQAWRTLVTAGLVPDRTLELVYRPENVANIMAEHHTLGTHLPGVTSLPTEEIRR